MSRRPAYLKTKTGSYWIIAAVLASLVWLVYGYRNDVGLQLLVERSELKGRTFQGQVEEIEAPDSGIKAYFMEEKDSPLVAISFLFTGAGTAYDNEDQAGIARLAAAVLKDGAGSKTAESLRDEMGLKGINISFAADRDVFSGQMTAPKDNLEAAAQVLQQILLKPRFDSKYVESAKAQMLKVLAAEKENPGQELNLAFNKLIYGAHPYGRNPLGNEQTLPILGQKDLQQFVRQKFSRGNVFVGIAGDLSKEEAVKLIDKIFALLPEKTSLPELAKPEIDWQQSIKQIDRESGQNIASFAAKGTCRKCEDFYPLYLANYIFGGSGLNSKLNQQIREKEGLTYGGYTALLISEKSDLLVGGFSATKDKFAKAEKMFRQEWRKIGKNGFSDDELRAAKDYLTASYNLRFASTTGIAEMLAYMQKDDLGLDFLQKRNSYIENVSLQQVNEAAKNYFNNDILQAKIGVFERGDN